MHLKFTGCFLKSTLRRLLFGGVFVAAYGVCASAQTTSVNNELAVFFSDTGVTGHFSLYDLKGDSYILFNPALFRKEFTPASTFKICNSLIGLETGVIKDENYVIKWDGVERQVKKWNADQDLKTAYKNSTVPYYQELARRVGGQQMYEWLKKAHYGNSDTSGGIDRFWLDGGLRVTPEQQIDFLKRLHLDRLPFSSRSTNIVKQIMIEESTSEYTLRAKTGWGEQAGESIGWYIGYVTKKENVYFFATCILTPTPDEGWPAKRKSITRKILDRLSVIPDNSQTK